MNRILEEIEPYGIVRVIVIDDAENAHSLSQTLMLGLFLTILFPISMKHK